MIKKTTGEKVFYVFNVFLMSLLCFTILFPYMNVVAVSLNDSSKSVSLGLMLVPKIFTLANYRALLNDSGIIRAFFVTVARIALSLALVISINFMSAYALTRKGLPHRKLIIMFFFIPNFISGGLIPNYILYSWLKLLNNFWIYVLPGGFSLYYFILLRTYMGTIPDSLDESARLDGASEIKIMLRIYLPLCLPMIATLALLITIANWNDWTTTLYFMSNYKWSTLAFELYRVLQEHSRIMDLIEEARKLGQDIQMAATTTEGIKNAQIVITTLPIIAVYPFLQKYFIKGLLIGGVKE